MISAIVFDYGGVIKITEGNQNEGNLGQTTADYLHIPIEEWQKVYFTFNYLCNTGLKSFQEVYELVARKLGASENQMIRVRELFLIQSSKKRKLNTELLEIIRGLKNRNYKIGLLSNDVSTLRQRLIDENIMDLFDVVIISGEVGYQKPQPEIFQILFEKLGVTSNEVVFIDDTARSLEGAEAIGYTPILFKDNNQFKEELDSLI